LEARRAASANCRMLRDLAAGQALQKTNHNSLN
jgi:hypothetical protein